MTSAPDSIGVEVEQHLVVDEFEPPYPCRHPPDAFEELGVAGEELLSTDPRLVGDVAFDQRLGDEPGPGLCLVDAVVADRAIADDRQAVQRHRLGGDGAPGLGVPPHVVVRALHEVSTGALGPPRVDLRDPAGVELVGLDQLGGHHPRRRTSREHRTGRDHEPRLARTDELACLPIAHPDVREQAGEHRLVDVVGVALGDAGR